MSDKSASRKLPREEAIMLLREAQADNNILRAEIDRLRADNVQLHSNIVELRARNEWLRQELAQEHSDKMAAICQAENLCAELATCHDTALEKAAKVCEAITQVPHGDGSYAVLFTHFGNVQCARAIRALKAQGGERD